MRRLLLSVVSPTSDELLHPVFDKSAQMQAKVLTRGLPASPGAASGQIVFFADDAEKWHEWTPRNHGSYRDQS